MNIEFSIKSKKFYEFLCAFDLAAAAVHNHEFHGKNYIKVNISFELDCDNQVQLYKFEISQDTEEKNVCKFINFPLEIQKMMIEKSSSKSYIPFLVDIRVGENAGGFDWCDTKEGHDFWDDIINRGCFNLFFEKYPKELFHKTALEVALNLIARDFIVCGTSVVDNYISYATAKEIVDKLNKTTELLTKNNENDENQLQGEKVPFRGADSRPGRVLRGSNKIGITIKSLGYKKVIGRG